MSVDLAKLALSVDANPFVKADKTMTAFNKTASNTEQQADKITKSTDRMARHMRAADASVGLLKGAFGALLAAVSIGKFVEIERATGILTASLKNATGSAQGAAVAFGAIQRLAGQLPESVESVTNAFVKMVNLGLDPSEAAIRSYSNTAAAMGKDLNQMIEAVADAATGEFERLKEFGIKARQQGEQVSFTFQGVTTTVAKESAAITGYLKQIGEVNFATAATDRMQELDGAMSNFGDTFDGLFRTINSKGLGVLIADTFRMATNVLQELNDTIASGQLGAYIDALGLKFSVFGNEALTAFNVVADGYDWLKQMLAPSAGGIADFLLDAFKNLPENIRAFIQLAVVEIAVLADKAKAYGEQIARNLNPITAIQDAIGGYEQLNAKLAGIDSARQDSIATIMDERDAALKAFDDQADKAGELRKKYDANNAALLDGGDVLGQFQIKADGATESAEKLAEKVKQAAEMMKIIEEMEMDDLFGDSDGIDPFAGIDDPAVQEAIKAQREEFDELINSVDEFGGAWTRTGSIVADSLGSIMDVMNDYSKQLESLGEAENKIALAREMANDPSQLREAEKAEKKLAKERTAANIGSFRAITGAASQMFSEQSKARKVLHNLEMAFSAIEMAMAIQRSFLAAKEAVLTQAKGDPYTAWARMAAMAAAVAALGYAVGGGGGGGGQTAEQIQESQGTGSVLGSNDKSESMLNAMEMVADTGIDQLAELIGIRQGLSGLTGGIDRLAIGVSTSGLADQKYIKFASTHLGVPLEAGSFELTGSRDIDDERRAALAPLQSQFVDIFKQIGSVINTGLESLGLTTNESINSFYMQLGKISFEGLSGEEIQQELNAILSQQADLITGHLIPSLSEYQQMGEGLFETLIRVAKEQAVFNDTIESMGLSLGGLSNLMRIDVAQSIITLMGGLEEFSEKTSEYFENFFSEDERVKILGDSLTEAFDAINQSLPESKKAFRDLVEGLDLTTDADQRLFASLMELNPSFSKYIDATEKAAEAQKNAADKILEAEKVSLDAAEKAQKKIDEQRQGLELKLLDELGMASEALAIRRAIELAAMDSSLHGLQNQIYAQQDLNRALKESEAALASALSAAQSSADANLSALSKAIDAERSLSQSRLDSAAAAVDAAQSERDLAADRYAASESALQASFAAEIAGINLVKDKKLEALNEDLRIAKEQQSAGASVVAAASAALEQAIQAEQKAREDSVKNQIDQYRKVAQEADKYAQSLRSLSDNLRQSIGAMAVDSAELSIARRVAAQGNVDKALAGARKGDFSGAMDLDLSALQNTDDLFKTKAERDYDIAVTQNKLAEIARLSDGQATIEEKAFNAAERSANSLEKQAGQLASINQGILSVSEATKMLADAQEQASSFDAIVAGLEAQIANEQLLADEQTAALQAQLDALIGVSDAVLSVDDAIKQFLDAKEQLQKMDLQLETAKTALAVAQSMYDAEIAAFDQIIAQQTAAYNAAIGIDESVKSVGIAIYDLNSSLINYAELNRQQQELLASKSNEQSVMDAQKFATDKLMADEITKLRAENKKLQEEMASSLKTISDNSTTQLNRDRLNA